MVSKTDPQGLEGWVARAIQRGASDVHFEPGLPPALRVRGELQSEQGVLPPGTLGRWAREVIGEEGWPSFLERRSADLSVTMAGARCRFNVFCTSRGVGFAVRVMSGTLPTLSSLNLHPSLEELARLPRGLVLVSGPTGSGKSSTIAALVEEINARDSRHVLTIEQPIEFLFRPRKAFVRQREVGRDTPSYEQAIRDALREDPDVLVVGELRHPETMQLALEAAETGHLVFTTMHSGTSAELIQRLVTAMPPGMQGNVRAQLADVLQAVICQRLVYRAELGIRVPELEILRATDAVRHFIRQGQEFKVGQLMEAGSSDGHWTVGRYRQWMDERVDWFTPEYGRDHDSAVSAELDRSLELADARPPDESERSAPSGTAGALPGRPGAATEADSPAEDVFVIEPPVSESLSELLSEIDDRDGSAGGDEGSQTR